MLEMVDSIELTCFLVKLRISKKWGRRLYKVGVLTLHLKLTVSAPLSVSYTVDPFLDSDAQYMSIHIMII